MSAGVLGGLQSLLCDDGLGVLKGSDIKSFELPHFEKGVLVWKLIGKDPNFLGGGEDVDIREPKCIFYDEKGESHIKASRALYEGAKKKCTMKGDVFAATNQGFKFSCAEMEFLMDDKKLVFPGEFHVYGEKLLLKAARGSYDIKTMILQTEGRTDFNSEP